MIQTVAYASQALRSAADDLLKTDSVPEADLQLTTNAKKVCQSLINGEKIRFRDLGILISTMAYELEKGNL